MRGKEVKIASRKDAKAQRYFKYRWHLNDRLNYSFMAARFSLKNLAPQLFIETLATH